MDFTIALMLVFGAAGLVARPAARLKCMVRMRRIAVEDLDDEVWISRRVVRNFPEAEAMFSMLRPGEDGLSGTRGRLTPGEAYRVVRGSKGHVNKDDGVCYATAGKLRANGFTVEHTPGLRNPDHVTISYDGDWDESVALLFKTSFSEEVWHEEGGVE